jgi:hypothetical protein
MSSENMTTQKEIRKIWNIVCGKKKTKYDVLEIKTKKSLIFSDIKVNGKKQNRPRKIIFYKSDNKGEITIGVVVSDRQPYENRNIELNSYLLPKELLKEVFDFIKKDDNTLNEK